MRGKDGEQKHGNVLTAVQKHHAGAAAFGASWAQLVHKVSPKREGKRVILVYNSLNRARLRVAAWLSALVGAPLSLARRAPCPACLSVHEIHPGTVVSHAGRHTGKAIDHSLMRVRFLPRAAPDRSEAAH